MRIEYTSVKDPVWGNAEKTQIELTVKFVHLEQEVPFTASKTDSAKHGRELFLRAQAGDFGEIKEYTPPTELEIAAEVNPGKLRREMDECVQKTQYWDMFGETEKAQAWRDYFRALAQLKGSKEWPIVKEWPERPESEQEVE